MLYCGLQQHRRYGRWAFAEFTDVYEIQREFNELLAAWMGEGQL